MLLRNPQAEIINHPLVMVTGHRPTRIGGYATPNPVEQWVRANIKALLCGYQRKLGPIEAMSGMALGTDQIFAEVAMDLGIPVHAAVPFAGQESQWPPRSQAWYLNLLHKCASVSMISEPGYEAWKMLKRDAYMVEQCDHAIAVWDGGKGGTGHTVGLLREAGKPTMWLDPQNLTVQPLSIS